MGSGSGRVLPGDSAGVQVDRQALFFGLSALGYAALVPLSLAVPWFWLGRLDCSLVFGFQTPRAVLVARLVCLVCLFGLYFAALLDWERLRFGAAKLAWMGFAFGGLAWCAPPTASADLFAYVGFARLIGLYGLNPYLHGYGEIADAYSPYAWWPYPMPYGPLVLPILALAAPLAQLGPLPALYFLKTVAFLLYGACAWVLFRLLKGLGRPDPEYLLFLFACNPVLVSEWMGEGHNDGLLVLCGLLALNALQRGRSALGLLLALLGALVKLPGVFLLAALAVLLVRERNWRALALGLLGGGALLLALKGTLLPDLHAVVSLLNPHQNRWNSLLSLIDHSHFYDTHVPATAHRLLMLGRTVLFALFCAWRLTRICDQEGAIRETLWLQLGFLIGYADQCFPWYLTWALPFAALTTAARLRRTVVLFSLSVLAFVAAPVAVFTFSFKFKLLRLAVAFGPPLGYLLHTAGGKDSRRPPG